MSNIMSVELSVILANPAVLPEKELYMFPQLLCSDLFISEVIYQFHYRRV